MFLIIIWQFHWRWLIGGSVPDGHYTNMIPDRLSGVDHGILTFPPSIDSFKYASWKTTVGVGIPSAKHRSSASSPSVTTTLSVLLIVGFTEIESGILCLTTRGHCIILLQRQEDKSGRFRSRVWATLPHQPYWASAWGGGAAVNVTFKSLWYD